MEALEQLAATGHASARVLRDAFAPPLAAVLLAATLVPAAAAWLLAGFAWPGLSPVLLPVVSRLGGEAALHYPGTLWALPPMLARLGAVTAWLLVPLATGWAATLAAYGRGGVDVVGALLATLQRLPRWLVAGAPLVIARDVVLGIQARALTAVAHRPAGAAAEVLLTFVADAAILALGAMLVPALVHRDTPLAALPGQARAAWSWGGAGHAAFGAGLAALGFAMRLAGDRVMGSVIGTHPDAAPVALAAVAAVAALGLVAFAGGSVVLAAALDDRWR